MDTQILADQLSVDIECCLKYQLKMMKELDWWRERVKGILLSVQHNDELVWFVGFYGMSTFVGYLIRNPFYENNQFYFKQFILAWVHSLIVKNISISNYSSSYI